MQPFPRAGPSSRSYNDREWEDHMEQGKGKDLYDEEEEQGQVSFDQSQIDDDLRLRTVQTAHSVIAESIRIETAKERRKRKRKELFNSFKRKTTISSTFGSTGRNRATSLGAISESTRSRVDSTVGPTSDFGSRPPSLRPPSAPPTLPPADLPKEPLSKRIANLLNGKSRQKPPERRTIYVNIPLPPTALHKGEPIVRYVRNKVRTAKYTLITYLPKNLFEQFHRVANIYFLFLVILQLFPVFGAPNAQIGMLPLLAILGMTAIKDGIEDWRRAKLDDQVNNSATTKLCGWRNVNQPTDPRSYLERLLGVGVAPGEASKGVRKLRQAEADTGKQIVMDARNAPSVQIDPPSRDGSEISYHKAPSTISMTSRRSVGVIDWSSPGAGTAGWERTLWKKLEVGDLILLRENEQVPADIIVLSTSNPDHLCFVETKNLDGETNLKVRKSLKATCSISSEEDLEHAHFLIDSEPPNANLYTYNGVLKYRPGGKETKQDAVTINEMLLRGCSLRNTKWIIGLVAFTGADTKIMLNGGDTPSKRSKIEKETNFNVAMNFALLMLLCLLTAILRVRDYQRRAVRARCRALFEYRDICCNYLLNIVPISLYITIEVIKTVQAYFIFQDKEMYYDVYDTPCVPKSWNVSDDLGQIEYVFSDKTGTLTQNIMEFKKCSIQGRAFGEGVTEAMMGAAIRDGTTLSEDSADDIDEQKSRMVRTMKPIKNRYLREDKLTLIAPELAERMVNPNDPLRPHIVDFFRALAVCHTVLSDTPEEGNPYVLDYKAESPDEAALVAAARDVGFPFIDRNNDRIDIQVLGKAERWVPLRVLEFNSTRKRMSVVARSPEGRIVLFCKGADTVIYERLARDHDVGMKEATLKDLEIFANGGLRTLCIASRELSEEEFQSWAREFDDASAAVRDREEAIDKACEKIEHSLTILGATALEDKLQEGVPEAIATLHQAGIKLWILTGDKLQTAIEIGYSCNLLTSDMEVMIISTDSESGARAQIEAGLNKIASMIGPPVVNKKGRPVQTPQTSGKSPTFAVVIDGESLRYALNPELKSLFLSLGTQCAAVICCRVSPSQKALTVRLVKEGCNAMTLAIGDGANDVAMIQEANIGVGLFGLEGSQAAMSADYAFGQFRFLTRLLLVHGRWSYVRVADMHANFFYKNVIWTIAMFWFLIFCSFDSTYLFEYTLLLLYNLIFTSVPVAVLGTFDQDTNAAASMAFPQLYKPGIVGREYTRTRFWLYMADGLYQSVILFFIPFLAYGMGQTWSSDGYDTNGLNEFGTTIACAGVIAANAYVGVNTRYWTVIAWVIIVGSTLLVFIWIPIYSVLATNGFVGTAQLLFPTFTFWATIILTVFLCIGPRWLVKSFKTSYLPRDKDIIREAWIAGDLKDQLGIAHRKANRRNKNKDRKGSKASSISDNEIEGVADRFAKDQRGAYFAADNSSPARVRSPSFGDVPRGYTYPPSPYGGPVNSGASTPSRQPIRPAEQFELVDTSASPARPMPPAGPAPQGSGSSQGYTSPTTTGSFNIAQPEISRMTDTSAQIGKAQAQRSLSDDSNGSISGQGGQTRRVSSRRGSRGQSSSPWATVPSPKRMNSGSGPPSGPGSDRADEFEVITPPPFHAPAPTASESGWENVQMPENERDQTTEQRSRERNGDAGHQYVGQAL